MTQTTEATLTTASATKATNFAGAFKNGAGVDVAAFSAFSNLLANSETTLPTVERRDPSPVAQTTTKSDNRRDASASQTRTTTAQDDTQSVAAAPEKPVEKTEAKTAQKPQDTNEDVRTDKNEAAENKPDAAEKKDTACLKQETKEEALEDRENQTAEEILASLLQPAQPCKNEMIEVRTQNKGEDAKEGTEEADQDTSAQDAAALLAMAGAAAGLKDECGLKVKGRQRGDAEGKEKADGAQQGQDRLADALSSTLNEKVNSKDSARQSEEVTDLFKPVDENQGQYAKMVGEMKESSTAKQQMTGASGANETNATAQKDTLSTFQLTAFGAGATAAQNQVAPEAGATESAKSAVQQVGSTSSASAAAATNGARPLGSYDFASQLSAARVTKGGAAGLPQAVEQVAVQLNKAAKDGVDEITIQLRPAELGKIEIKLEFGADKSVKSTIIAESQATLNLLEKDSSSLQHALQEAGLQADAGSMQFSLRDQNNAGQFSRFSGHGNSTSMFANDNAGTDGGVAEAALSASETYYVTPGRVNLHV